MSVYVSTLMLFYFYYLHYLLFQQTSSLPNDNRILSNYKGSLEIGNDTGTQEKEGAKAQRL